MRYALFATACMWLSALRELGCDQNCSSTIYNLIEKLVANALPEQEIVFGWYLIGKKSIRPLLGRVTSLLYAVKLCYDHSCNIYAENPKLCL